jgi:uncharacterized ferritin-like protein (DUF455 family)
MTGADRPDPALFGEGPARDARFTVVEQWADCVNLPESDPEHEMEFYHRQMNEELNVLENCARNLIEFRDVEWSIRKGIARQASDEARHTATYKRLYESRGGEIGRYPVMNFQYKILGKIDNLPGRFAVQNRTFEADGLDAVTAAIEEAKAAGDTEVQSMYEIQQADEVLHVQYANGWIWKQAAEDPRVVLQVVRAVSQALEGLAWVTARGGGEVTKYPMAVEERIEAGFSRAEAELAHEKNEQRRRAIRTQAAGS